MGIVITFISGVMFGVEYLWEESILVVDVGIFRFMIGKIGE